MPSMKCKSCGKDSTDDKPMKRCPCKLEDAIYCDQVCQNSDWKNHKKACQAARKAQSQNGGQASISDANGSCTNESDEPSIIKAVDLTGGYNVPFHPVSVQITSDHEMFHGKGHLSPVSKLIGQPILVYRHLQDDPFDYITHPQRERFDNSSVTFLMIDPATGMAPPRWQQGVGRVTVARQDKSPLNSLDLEKIWMYCDRIIDGFEYGGAPRHLYNSAAYEKWAKNYRG